MESELESAIKANAENAKKKDVSSADALRYTQACVNAANALLALATLNKK